MLWGCVHNQLLNITHAGDHTHTHTRAHASLIFNPRHKTPQLMLPAEAAHDITMALGELGLLQFRDMNSEKSSFQRTYANQARAERLLTGRGRGEGRVSSCCSAGRHRYAPCGVPAGQAAAVVLLLLGNPHANKHMQPHICRSRGLTR